MYLWGAAIDCRFLVGAAATRRKTSQPTRYRSPKSGDQSPHSKKLSVLPPPAEQRRHADSSQHDKAAGLRNTCYAEAAGGIRSARDRHEVHRELIRSRAEDVGPSDGSAKQKRQTAQNRSRAVQHGSTSLNIGEIGG
jgi:hypothetical protein